MRPDIQQTCNIYFENMLDEEIVECVRVGDTQALEFMITKYKNFVKSKARTYFLIGADKEDIVQEGMIGLYKAIRDFREDKLSSFRAFAELCITRQIITAIKTATRQKHIPLNSYISLNKPVFEEGTERTLMEVLTHSNITNPEQLMINREDLESIEAKVFKVLSKFELRVLSLFIKGRSYIEIASDLDKSVKSIDNALQRIKRKLETFI